MRVHGAANFMGCKFGWYIFGLQIAYNSKLRWNFEIKDI